jgi:hypothetical protein
MTVCIAYSHAREQPIQENHKFQSHISSDITYEHSHDSDIKVQKLWIMWNFRTHLNRKSNRIAQNNILNKIYTHRKRLSILQDRRRTEAEEKTVRLFSLHRGIFKIIPLCISKSFGSSSSFHVKQIPRSHSSKRFKDTFHI